MIIPTCFWRVRSPQTSKSQAFSDYLSLNFNYLEALNDENAGNVIGARAPSNSQESEISRISRTLSSPKKPGARLSWIVVYLN